ncbi:MAG: hypothetical protein J6B03_00035 [Candidatus Homeothermus sp.]|nr:hypothetical protein [Candidatus Homeothermus sp.]
MNKSELIQALIHKKMEAKARLEFFKIVSPQRYQEELDVLLDRINEIERLLEELEKK